MNYDLSATFSRFAGKEVNVIEKKQTLKVGGREYDNTSVALTQNNPILDELKAEIAKTGLRLRIWLPGTIGTMDFRTDRLNVRIGKDPVDGKYKIGNKFNLG